jgi:hypothetical protein
MGYSTFIAGKSCDGGGEIGDVPSSRVKTCIQQRCTRAIQEIRSVAEIIMIK